MAMAVPAGEVVATPMLIPFRKTRAFHLAKKIVGNRTIDEAVVDTKARKQCAELELHESIAQTLIQAETVKEARAAFDKLGAEIDTKIEEEISAAMELREVRINKGALATNTYTLRMQLFEAQKKLALLEVIAVNRQKMKAFAEETQVAVKAVEDVNRQISLEKKFVKQNLEAARRAWDDVEENASKRSSNIPACGSASKRPRLHGKPIASPSLSQATLKNSSSRIEQLSPTFVQSGLSHAATLVDDAQQPGSF